MASGYIGFGYLNGLFVRLVVEGHRICRLSIRLCVCLRGFERPVCLGGNIHRHRINGGVLDIISGISCMIARFLHRIGVSSRFAEGQRREGDRPMIILDCLDGVIDRTVRCACLG